MPKKISRITVLGDGGWGTTLAVHLARKGLDVTLWGAFPENIEFIRKNRVNTKFLPGIPVPNNIDLTAELTVAIDRGELIVLAVPSQHLTAVLKKVRACPLDNKIFLSVVKGIDCQKLLRMSQLIFQELGHIDLAVLSGPTIAREVAAGIPSTAVIAANKANTAKLLQKIFHSQTFRIYTNNDMTGLELGGSLKNIIAIACGVCDGLGFGTNTKAAILTRGLVEMARLGVALGAKKTTFAGLAGLGDLVTTCMSQESRNRFVGEQLGKGKKITEILSHMDMVAEGVATSQAVQKLSRKLNVPMPICTEVFNIIYKGKTPKKAVNDLMTRQLKAE